MEILKPTCDLPKGVVAFFTARSGGVSDPPYHSLNLSISVGDDIVAAHENRLRLMEKVPASPRWLRQAHGSRILSADTVQEDVDVADASYTRTANVVCAVQTADCLPVLFYHADGRGVGVAHAGWRGLADGILEQTATLMQRHNDSPLFAYIGPAISAAHYPVGAEVYESLCRETADEQAFRPTERAGEWYADLKLLAKRRLLAAGIAEVNYDNYCTYADSELFFSARREPTTGRQAAVIWTTKGKAATA